MISFSNIKAETLDSGTPDRSVHVSDYIIRLHNLTESMVSSESGYLPPCECLCRGTESVEACYGRGI